MNKSWDEPKKLLGPTNMGYELSIDEILNIVSWTYFIIIQKFYFGIQIINIKT